MEANELRIGNLANHSELGIVEVIAVGKEYIHCIFNGETFYENIGAFSPIPLTEEWLLKFGFIKVLDYPCFRLDGLQIEFNGFDSQCGSGLLDENTLTKYVHQLQNLFFALKGKELTLK